MLDLVLSNFSYAVQLSELPLDEVDNIYFHFPISDKGQFNVPEDVSGISESDILQALETVEIL